MEMTVYHQNFMLALRQQMGWPAFKPANDCIGWSSGAPMDTEVGMELARIAQMLGKDIVYSGWNSATARTTSGFSIAFRELLTIDIVDSLVPWAANDDEPIVLVSTRGDEKFGIDQRGTMVRTQGKPKNIAKGRKLALQRIKNAAAGMDDDLLANNRHVLPGDVSIEPEAATETLVRFA
ncbi:hypothetical protein [Stakelama marina]|uniref:Uncharacterized protein n=1 Tax=Stakelama marina TaxID=2826939 RepID=A0A8T4I980_9SPHN|nr:hypothetical protein [Stakelama marina]MBR0551060.1 hypothetical protein [Stakelama marina]